MSEETEPGTGHDRPIIVVKKNIKHGGHHGGAWKVAYADFVTAMMAFFLVMWLVSQTDDVKKAVQGYFQDPANFEKNYKISLIKGGAGVLKGGSASQLSSKPSTPAELEKQQMQQLASRLRQIIDDTPGLDVLKKHVEIELTREGLRIQLIEGSSDVSFFKAGSANLSLRGELILKTIAMELKRLPNQMVIEGHTDASDIARGESYTNWELSADRANAARRAMMDGGLQPGQVYQVRGYAANKPRIKDNPNDPRNRRITILVLNRLLGEEPDSESYQSPIIMSKG